MNRWQALSFGLERVVDLAQVAVSLAVASVLALDGLVQLVSWDEGRLNLFIPVVACGLLVIRF